VFDRGNEKIENYIKPYGIDFIVMGSHGAKGIRELVIGSNTQRIVRHVKIPVLVIKEKPATLEFKNIVFASTFQENVMNAFKEVAAFAMLLNSKVDLVYINRIDHLVESQVAEEKMKTLAARYPAIEYSSNMAETNNEEWAIHQFAGELKADIISITSQEKDGRIPFLSPSIAEVLVNHENKPVLVLGAT
jgi:nucleotide-binding universal stress UspA family protein